MSGLSFRCGRFNWLGYHAGVQRCALCLLEGPSKVDLKKNKTNKVSSQVHSLRDDALNL